MFVLATSKELIVREEPPLDRGDWQAIALFVTAVVCNWAYWPVGWEWTLLPSWVAVPVGITGAIAFCISWGRISRG